MIRNDNITSEYGSFAEIGTGTSPVPYKAQPSPADYSQGYVTRIFAKKLNENIVIEIKNEQAATLNQALYQVVSLRWQITGPKYSTYVGNIVDKMGVIEHNQFAIQTVQTETGIDLSKVLANHLEYWQGR